MRLSNLHWIVQLFIIICAIGIEAQPSGMKSREKIHSFQNENSEANACGNTYAKHRMKRSNPEGLLDEDPNASGMRLQPSDQNTCQMSPNLAAQSLSPAVPVSSLSDFYQSNWQQPQQTELQNQQQQQPHGLGRMSQGTPNAYYEHDETEQRRQELRNLVQHLYVAQARVQLEAIEIRKAQSVASAAQTQLEESANHVRSITASLHTAQQEVAASAIRAQIAQLQLAAHDQLLFAARQDVDALSSQMVGLQAAEGIVQPKLTVDLHALLDKLKQPLQQYDRPTAVPLIAPSLPGTLSHQQQMLLQQQQMGQVQDQGPIQGQGQNQDQGQGPVNPSNGPTPNDFISLPRAHHYANMDYT
ncbi:chromatin modification-related protein eaf-1 isoform X2 [Drosophila mauritiana]|uniref:Chromatin modification-related protein eaf-1 isoform X2 n=1 Tax=Drosophila mauritiana TaxID=7226 RepID=A0A6P8K0N4_DROMA|nr:chromatin modification-related protein eaf-1 isoform X2 [Drosophila mauritiana]